MLHAACLNLIYKEECVCLFFIHFHTVAPPSGKLGMMVEDLLRDVMDTQMPQSFLFKCPKDILETPKEHFFCLSLKNHLLRHMDFSYVGRVQKERKTTCLPYSLSVIIVFGCI